MRAGCRQGSVACGGSRFTIAIAHVALVAGRRGGLFQGEQPSSIDGINKVSQRWAIAHHFNPWIIQFLCRRRRKNDDKDVNQRMGQFGVQ
jgi:hypothetical protein